MEIHTCTRTIFINVFNCVMFLYYYIIFTSFSVIFKLTFTFFNRVRQNFLEKGLYN
jgi:hypothetical protein